MKIRAGKRYVTRSGLTTEPIRRDLWLRCWSGAVLGIERHWRKGGCVEGPSWAHDFDLVAEYQEPGK